MGFTSIPGRPQPAIPEAPADNEAWGRENAGWVRVVAVAGDTMTGPLTLPAVNPVADNEASRKLYVDETAAALQLQIDTLAAGLIYVGAYDVLLDEAIWTLASGLVDGPLPPADAPGIEAGFYLICTSTGTGTGNAPPVILRAGDQLISGGPTGGTAWNVLPVGGQASTTADLVALNPVIPPWNNVQQAIQGLHDLIVATDALARGMVADVQPTEMRITDVTQTWATINVSNLPRNSQRRFLWLCQPNLYQAGGDPRTFSFSVPGIFASNRELIQPGPPAGYPAFQVWLVGTATTDGNGAISMPVTVRRVAGTDVVFLGGGGGITLRSRIQVFDMGAVDFPSPPNLP
jgi:hypothetical protein